MKIISNPYSLLLAAVLVAMGLTACEKVIDISIPDKERKIVVNGLISADQPVMVSLSRSLSVLEKDSLIAFPGAEVKLFHGTDLIGKFEEKVGGFYTLPGFIPEVGQTYRLTASADGLKSVEATATLPPVIPMISVDTTTLTGEWGQKELRVSVKFQDPAGISNIYGFGAIVTYKEFDYATMSYTGKMQTTQAYLYGNTDRFLKDESTNFDGKLYFDDLLFDGMAKTIEFAVPDISYYELDTVWLTVNMEQLDRPYYYYILSYSAYQQAQGNPFAEPVQVYSNVAGGFGIFSGSSTSSYSIITLGKKKFR